MSKSLRPQNVSCILLLFFKIQILFIIVELIVLFNANFMTRRENYTSKVLELMSLVIRFLFLVPNLSHTDFMCPKVVGNNRGESLTWLSL